MLELIGLILKAMVGVGIVVAIYAMIFLVFKTLIKNLIIKPLWILKNKRRLEIFYDHVSLYDNEPVETTMVGKIKQGYRMYNYKEHQKHLYRKQRIMGVVNIFRDKVDSIFSIFRKNR